MKKISEITTLENNPIKKAISSTNLKSKFNEVKSEVKGISSSISNALVTNNQLNSASVVKSP